MEFMWRKPCPCGDCDVKHYGFCFGKVKVDYFAEVGEWFLYVYYGNRYWRFSSAGYLKG